MPESNNVKCLSPIPEKVYHYTSIARGLEGILQDKKFILGSLGKTNDPIETQHIGFAFLDYAPSPGEKDYGEFATNVVQMDTEANRIRAEEYFHISLTMDDPDIPSAEQSNTGDSFYKHGFSRSKMWAQYGENHRGVCIEFNGPALHEEIRNEFMDRARIIHGTVEYVDLSTPDNLIGPLVDLTNLGAEDIDVYLSDYIYRNAKSFFSRKYWIGLLKQSIGGYLIHQMRNSHHLIFPQVLLVCSWGTSFQRSTCHP